MPMIEHINQFLRKPQIEILIYGFLIDRHKMAPELKVMPLNNKSVLFIFAMLCKALFELALASVLKEKAPYFMSYLYVYIHECI